MKFIHAADIHLDSPLRGLPDYDGAPTEEVRSATRAAFKNMVNLAIEEAVDFVVIAGDLYDGDWKDFNTGLFFGSEMVRLNKANIPVYVVLGNHDAESRMTKSLSLPSNVHQFRAGKPETKKIENLKVALHGQSFKTPDTKDNLAAAYPVAVDGYFNIGVLHTAAEGRENHEPYAPCSVADLVAKGYDYWALGHVHKREVISENPFVVFPGNLQGRHIRETAENGKGCTLVTVDEAGRVELSHRVVDTVRWAQVQVDISGTSSMSTLIDRVGTALESAFAAADGRLLAVRFALSGNTKLHGQILSDQSGLLAELRALAIDVGVGEIWVEKAVVNTLPEVSLEELAERGDILGDVARELRALRGDADFRATLANAFSDLFTKLPNETKKMRPNDEGLSCDDQAMAALIDRASDVLVSKLAGVEGEE